MKELWLLVSILGPALVPVAVRELFLTSSSSCRGFLPLLTSTLVPSSLSLLILVMFRKLVPIPAFVSILLQF